MNTSARASANRRNAKKSTGPRTTEGKSRVATNAHRHGLAVPMAALPELETRVATLARRIAGENPSISRAELARRVAEAQVDLQRVRAAKLLFSNGSIKIAPRPTVKGGAAIIRLTSKALDGDGSAEPRSRRSRIRVTLRRRKAATQRPSLRGSLIQRANLQSSIATSAALFPDVSSRYANWTH